MTDDELAQQKQRLDEQLEVAIRWLRDAHRAQVQALEAAWAASRLEEEEPGTAPATLPAKPRRGSLAVYDEVVSVLDRLPVEFTKNDVCRLLGSTPDRVSLFRALQRLSDEDRIEVVHFGGGRRTTVYRLTRGSGAARGGG